MTNFTNVVFKYVQENFRKSLSCKLSCLAIFACVILSTVVSLTAQEHTDNNKDMVLRGSGRVNPSTLGLELSIPLAEYKGRGIDIPISLNYSSKVWRAEFLHGQPRINNPESCILINEIKYAERSAGGWTSSTAVPYIEYTGLENVFDERGFALSGGCSEYGPVEPHEFDTGYVKRITIHLPGGQSHELRAGDSIVLTSSSGQEVPGFDGTFYAVDGSNLRYIEDAASGTYKLRLPDGSFYDFSTGKEPINGSGSSMVRKAVKFEDRNGNAVNYNAGTSQITDTLGRVINSPFGFSEPEQPTAPNAPVVYNLPGLNGTSVTYKFHWKRLNGGSQSESALTDIYDPSYQLKYMADRSSANPNIPPRASETSLFTSQLEAWVLDNEAPLFNPVVLSKIELPTGLNYQFTYDNYGRIEKIIYPTGGIEKVTYDTIPTLSAASEGGVSGQTNFGVVTRKVYSGPTSAAYVWNYSVSTVPPSGYKITTVSPENIKSERHIHRGSVTANSPLHGSFGYDDALAGMPYDELTYDKNNVLVSRTRSFWTKTEKSLGNAEGNLQKADWHPRLTHEQKYVYDPVSGAGLKALTRFEYENESGLTSIDRPVLTKKVFNYGFENAGSASLAPGYGSEPEPSPPSVPPNNPGELLRVESSTFLINDPSIPTQVRQNYRDRNLVGLITAKELLDSGLNVVSRETATFDEPGYASGDLGNPTTTGVWDSSIGPFSEPSAYLLSRQKYDDYGNVIEKTDTNGNTSFTEYDAVHRAFPARMSSPVPDADGINGSSSSLVTTTTYDAVTGLLLSSTDPNGLESRTEYEPNTLRIRRTAKYFAGAPLGGATEIEYMDVAGAIAIKTRRQIDAQNWSEKIRRFDGLGRLTQAERAEDSGSVFVDKEYDSNGRVSRVSNPYRTGENREWTTNEYDDAGRIERVKGPDGSEIIVDHGVLVSDRRGVRKTITDQSGRSRTGLSNSLGQMFAVIEDPDGQALESDYIFDASGRVRETIQGNQHRYFMFDSVGRLIFSKQPEQETNPDFEAVDPVTSNSNWSSAFEYDSNGNVIRTSDARGISTDIQYDSLNRITKRSFSDETPEVTFFYDGTGLGSAPQNSRGLLTRMSSSASESRFLGFDPEGKVLQHEQITAGKTYETSYEYNLAGHLTAETYPSGRRMQYDRNVEGLLESVRGTKPGIANAKLYLDEIDRNSSGQIVSSRLGNGRFETFSYNNRAQITNIGLGHSYNAEGLISLEFGYGISSQNNGSLRTQKLNFSGLDAEIVQSYEYDALNRIISTNEAVGNNETWREAFSYDRFGNRVFDASATNTISQMDGRTNPQVNSQNNRIESFQDGDSNIDYVYDRAGNLLVDAENRRFVYTAENRITSYFKGTNTSSVPDATYEYDGEGNRVRKIDSERESVFVYNALGKLIAEYSDKLPETPKISYLTKDHLGSTRVVTDGAGTVVSRQDYMAFGENLTDKIGNMSGRNTSQGYGSDAEVRKQYTGYERDKESGLDFAQARYYSSAQGRFTSVDPLTASADLKNPQTFNRYSYVLNSPYKFVDPLGLISKATSACGQFCSNREQGITMLAQMKKSAPSPSQAQSDPVEEAADPEVTYDWFADEAETELVASANIELDSDMVTTLGDDAAEFANLTEDINASYSDLSSALQELPENGVGYTLVGGADGSATVIMTSENGEVEFGNDMANIKGSPPTVQSNIMDQVNEHNKLVDSRNALYTERKTAFQNKFHGRQMNIQVMSTTLSNDSPASKNLVREFRRTDLGKLYDIRIGGLAGKE